MKKTIIGIHGLDNKPQKQLLEKWWKKSITDGLYRIGKPRISIPFELVYWADILYNLPLDPAETDPTAPGFIPDPYYPFRKQEIKKKHRRKIVLLRFFETALDKIIFTRTKSSKIIRLVNRFIQKRFRDLDIYFSPASFIFSNRRTRMRDAIQQRLSEVLSKYRRRKILLIAHSMGSIIAYEVLLNLPKTSQVPIFATVGSPMGLPVIIKRIAEEQQIKLDSTYRLKTPECVSEAWYNFSDPDDPVAVNYNLADDYSPNSQNIGATDVLVQNGYTYNEKKNAHKIYGYLRTSEMAELIDRFLSEDKTTLKSWLSEKWNWVGSRLR